MADEEKALDGEALDGVADVAGTEEASPPGGEPDGGDPSPEGDLIEGAARPGRGRPMEYLFNVSAFVLIVLAVFAAFGGLILARILPARTAVALHVRNLLALHALATGGLFLMVGLAMKLYCALAVVRSCSWGDGLAKRSEWFLKIAAVTFTTATAAVVCGSAVFLSRYVGPVRRVAATRNLILRQVAGSVSLQALGIASFFLLLGLFSLIHLLHLKLVSERRDEASR